MSKDEDENRDKLIPIKFTKSEKESIIFAAEEDSRTVSSWCRLIILEKLNDLREHKEE